MDSGIQFSRMAPPREITPAAGAENNPEVSSPQNQPTGEAAGVFRKLFSEAVAAVKEEKEVPDGTPKETLEGAADGDESCQTGKEEDLQLQFAAVGLLPPSVVPTQTEPVPEDGTSAASLMEVTDGSKMPTAPVLTAAESLPLTEALPEEGQRDFQGKAFAEKLVEEQIPKETAGEAPIPREAVSEEPTLQENIPEESVPRGTFPEAVASQRVASEEAKTQKIASEDPILQSAGEESPTARVNATTAANSEVLPVKEALPDFKVALEAEAGIQSKPEKEITFTEDNVLKAEPERDLEKPQTTEEDAPKLFQEEKGEGLQSRGFEERISPSASANVQDVSVTATPQEKEAVPAYSQISKEIMQRLEQKGPSEFRMSLEPADLGEIEIRMQLSAGKLVIDIAAVNSRTQSLLAGQVNDLVMSMGLQNVKVEVVQTGNNVMTGYETTDNQTQAYAAANYFGQSGNNRQAFQQREYSQNLSRLAAMAVRNAGKKEMVSNVGSVQRSLAGGMDYTI